MLKTKQLAMWENPKRPATNASEWLPYGRQRHSQRLDVPTRCKSRRNRHVTCGPIAILPQANSDGGLVLAMAVGPEKRLLVLGSWYLAKHLRARNFREKQRNGNW